MNRRDLLRATGAAGAVSLAGCTGLFGTTTTNSREPPLVENRPDAVYVPTHREGMNSIGMARAGDLMVATSYSYAHRFWPVENDGGEWVATRQDVERDDAVHLMTRVWEPESGTVVPDAGVTVELSMDDEAVFEEVVYPMLSQRMGSHYGDNAPVGGDGVHELNVTVGGLDDLARFGDFEGRFDSAATATFEWEYSEAERNRIPFEILEERQGTRGALPMMEMSMGGGESMGEGESMSGGESMGDGMSMPMGTAPESLPGESLGRTMTNDVRVAASVVTDDRFGADPYLLVSPRTRYHGYALGGMGLSATVSGGKFDGGLSAGLDPEAGHHYGASVPGLTADDTVEVTVDTPPAVARHEGYETAFFDVGSVTLNG